MPTDAAPAAPKGAASIQSRRQRLFELHSFLRSVDNLRPDEALDAIAAYFELWAVTGSLDGAGPALSRDAAAGAVERLAPIFEEIENGYGGDLFQELADVGVRAGMGQYFTPRPVAEAMAAFLRPAKGESWLDPFCGSGLLLGKLTGEADGDLSLFGIDRDPRVLTLARVEATLHHPTSSPSLLQANALEDAPALLERLGAPAAGVDGVVANPPFGAEVHEGERTAYSDFELAKGSKTSLELLGLEQCGRLLRPGGRLGIVLPQSVLSNRSLAHVREYILREFTVAGVLGLPPETFLPFKGVGKASVLFLTKSSPLRSSFVSIGISRSAGWDATGRSLEGEDMVETARAMRAATEHPMSGSSVLQSPALSRNLTAEWLSRPSVDGRALGDLCSAIYVGPSPGRAAYEEAGTGDDTYRMLKVGDLTNHGVDWSLGERSLARLRRAPREDRLLRVGDLALTATAHHPRYIAAKVDYIDCLPDEFAERCLPVAEVLVLRPKPEEIDPMVLLLWMRSEEGRGSIQSCITGQTAHLSSADVADVVVPCAILGLDGSVAAASLHESLYTRRRAEAIAEEATLDFEARIQAA